MSLAFFWIFLVLMTVGTPVVFALLIAPGLSLVIDGKDQLFFSKILSTVYNGMYSFPLMAVPFFILAGELMSSGGITRSLVEFSKSMIGHVRGGLAQVDILTSILFAGLSGSAVADVSATGKMMIPAMEHSGYPRPFAAAVTASSAIIGPIIPPSGIMILYAFVMNVSVGGLFLAGFVPGLMIGLGLMALVAFYARRYGFPVAGRRATWGERSVAFLRTWPALMTPVLLLGLILSGVTTATEAAGVAALYALLAAMAIRLRAWRRLIAEPVHAYLYVVPVTLFTFLGFFGHFGLWGWVLLVVASCAAGEVLWRMVLARRRHFVAPPEAGEDGGTSLAGAFAETRARLPRVFTDTAFQSGVVLFLIGAAVTFGWMITVSGLAREAAEVARQFVADPLLLFLVVNLLLFVVGMFLDAGPAILILGPVLGPIMTQAGIDPIHFAIVMCVNVTVGLATPPMGLVLFVTASIANEKLERIIAAIWPFILVEVAVIFLITYVPSLTMTLPAVAGFANCPSDATVCQAIVSLAGGTAP